MTLRKTFITLLVFAAFAAPLCAQRRGDQGYGLMIGNPSGFSAKMWIDETVAVDAAAGVDRGEFDIHASLLFHKFNWTNKSKFVPIPMQEADERGELPFYFGFGPRLLFEDEKEFGLRFPVGISYLPKTSPFEVFFELAPVLRITEEVGFNGDFAVGARYYFQAIRPMGEK
jgi:hypothetical protein